MPSTSEKQRRFMGMNLAKQRKTGRNPTGMSEQQLKEFAGSVHKKETKEKPGRSIVDVEWISRAPSESKLEGSHPVHKGYGSMVEGDLEASEGTCNRAPKYGVFHGAPVSNFGPDTDFYVEEINPHHYGRDYEPAPFKDLFKTEDKAEELDIRDMEEYEYSEIETPGSVNDDLTDCSTETYGSTSYKTIKRDLEDNRTFKDQQRFRRSQKELENEFFEEKEEHITR